MNKQSVELTAAVLFAAMFAFLAFNGIGYTGRSAYMPTAASGIGFVMSCIWALQSVRQLSSGHTEPLEFTGSDVSRFSLILAFSVVYIAGFLWIGFFTSTAIMVPVVAWALGYRDLKVIALTTFGFTLILYLVFRLLLAVPLPREAILTLSGA